MPAAGKTLARAAALADSSFVALIEDVAAATAEATTVDEAMQACVERVCRWSGWPVGHAFLVGDRLRSSHIWHLADATRFEPFRALTARTELDSGVGLPGRVAASCEPEWIVDFAREPKYPRAAAAAQAGLRGAFCFPVPVDGSVFAVVECLSA
ncbi:MAG TPA: GAF domain-containing protein, partial [Solirubrobacter sp.]|nr:GAF domain-containing protein [Solirubrobacter sp.]